MTVWTTIDRAKPMEVDLHNKIDPKTGIRYLGHAWCDLWTGRWLCMADNGALCIVEVKLVVDGDAGTPIGVRPPSDNAPVMSAVERKESDP